MSNQGFTIKKEVVVNEEVFQAKLPAFTAPVNPAHVDIQTPKQKDNEPKQTLLQQATKEGKLDIAEMLLQVKLAAKAQAKIKEDKPRKGKGKAKAEKVASVPYVPAIEPAFVVSDLDFVKRTRAGDLFSIHSEEAKSLFWSNGGEKFLVGDVSYAAAYDMLRRIKLNGLVRPANVGKIEPYTRAPFVQGRAFTPGMPTSYDRSKKYQRELEANNRAANERAIFGIRK